MREDEIKPGDREASREAAGMLAVSDAERLMGFPEGWTEPCARASRPNTPEHDEKSESHRDTSDDDAPDVDVTPSPEPEAKATATETSRDRDVASDVLEGADMGADEDDLVARNAPSGERGEPPRISAVTAMASPRRRVPSAVDPTAEPPMGA